MGAISIRGKMESSTYKKIWSYLGLRWKKIYIYVCEGDPGLIPELGGSAGEGNGNPLQCSCLGNPMDRGLSPRVHKELDTTGRLIPSLSHGYMMVFSFPKPTPFSC